MTDDAKPELGKIGWNGRWDSQPQTDAKKAALLPCPFCGNPPKSGDNTYGYWLIFCSDENNCSAQPVVGHKTEAEAIAGWNTRQPQTDDNEDFGDTVLDFGVELLFAVIGLETEPHGTTAVFEVELRGRTRKVTVTCAKLEATASNYKPTQSKLSVLRWLTSARAEAASIFRGVGLAAFHGLTGFIYGTKQMTLRQFLQDNFGWDIYDWADEEIRF